MAVNSTNDNSLFFSTGLDNSGLQRGAFDAVGIIQGMASNISKINPFAALSIAAVGAFTLIANEGYKMARDFESAMAEVKTIANLSEKDFAKLEKQVFSLYKTLGTEPPDKLANGLYEIIGAGFEANDALKLLEISSKSATAGVTTSAVASDGLTTILNAFKLGIEDAERVADIMFATVDRGKISFEQLSSQISIVAPLAAASGFSFEEIGGAIATLTKQGVPASVALTQIRSAIISTNDVLGSGVSETLSLQDAFQKMYEIAGGDQNVLKELAGRIEAVNGILGIAGDNALGAAEDYRAMSNAAGSVDKAFNIITSTTANQWEIFGNRIRSTTKGIGDVFVDMSNSIASGLNSALDSLEGVTDEAIEQAAKFRLLRNELNSSNTSYERKVEILKQLKTEYPEYLSSLDLDKINNNNLNDVLKKVKKTLEEINEEHKKRIELIGFNEDVADAQKALLVQERTLERAQTRFFKNVNNLVKEATAIGIELDFSLADDPEKIVKEIKEKLPDSRFDILGAGGDLTKSLEFLKRQRADVEAARKELDRVTVTLDKQRMKLYDNEQGYKKIVAQISKIRSLEGLEQFKDFKFSKIVDAVKDRKAVITDLNEIAAVTQDQYSKNKNILKEFLDSENEEIRKAAEQRKAFFELKPRKKPKEDNRTADEKFADGLKERENQFKSYNLALKNNDDDLAKKLKENYKLKENDYITYLRNLYNITESQSQKALILEALDKQNSGLNNRPVAKALDLEAIGVTLDFTIDTTSYNAVYRRIIELEKKARKATTASEQKAIGEKLSAERKKLKAIEDRINKSKNLEDDFFNFLQTSSLRDLLLRRNQYRKELDALKAANREKTKEYEDLAKKIRKLNEEIGQDFAGIASSFSGIFNELSSLFSKFGDDDLSQLMDQLAGVAQGVATFAQGYATGDPLAMIQGGLQVLNSALTVEVVSDTAKFEEAIKELEKAIDRLDYVISRSVGQDKVSNRRDAINDLEELQEQAELARQAELKARKEVKFLGVRLWSKGSGSGTSAEKLDELEEKAEEARRKAEELRDQLNELYTGTTEETIVDTIISGLKEGKRDIEDFADDIKDILQNALLQAFQIKYLEKEIEKFYDMFASAGEDQNYSAEELAELVNFINSIITGAQEEIDAINEVLEAAGIGGLGSNNDQQGLAGAISTITEDTANILAGTLNSIRIDIATGLEIAEQNSSYLSEIVQNTSYNRFLEAMDIKLNSIDTKL